MNQKAYRKNLSKVQTKDANKLNRSTIVGKRFEQKAL